METTFSHEEANAKGSFIMQGGGEDLANLTYSRIDANNIIVDHTAVNPNHKGEGIGGKIVVHVVQWARDNDQKILPLCPFTKGYIDTHPELQDILRK